MKQNVTLHPHAPADGYPAINATIEIEHNAVGIMLLAPDEKTERASIYIEYYNGRVIIHVWNEDDQDGDSTEAIILIPDPRNPPPD